MQPEKGFREHAHTADWELEVWAPDLPTLLEQAARGMYGLSGVRLRGEARQEQTMWIKAEDAESLLVQFLSNLLWAEEDQQLGFDQMTLKITRDYAYQLEAVLSGAHISGMDKEIKAVTYHNLAVQNTPEGLRVVIVFDV
jgi:SHS2 domain-containing protein